MTQEEYELLKELLLKDLCARLPYGVIGQCEIDASYDTSFDTSLMQLLMVLKTTHCLFLL